MGLKYPRTGNDFIDVKILVEELTVKANQDGVPVISYVGPALEFDRVSPEYSRRMIQATFDICMERRLRDSGEE